MNTHILQKKSDSLEVNHWTTDIKLIVASQERNEIPYFLIYVYHQNVCA